MNPEYHTDLTPAREIINRFFNDLAQEEPVCFSLRFQGDSDGYYPKALRGSAICARISKDGEVILEAEEMDNLPKELGNGNSRKSLEKMGLTLVESLPELSRQMRESKEDDPSMTFEYKNGSDRRLFFGVVPMAARDFVGYCGDETMVVELRF